ncbi:hypothetical protein ACP4OV_005340 [Aristida adscensionis]
MDELVSPASTSWSPPTMASLFSPDQVLEFVSCAVPEQWLLKDGDGGSTGSAGADLSGIPTAPAARRRRGRKPGPRANAPAISHVEAERQRRDKLNRRFCELRAAVPTVSRMDKASLLADAADYIAELRRRVEQLEAEARNGGAPSSASGSDDAATAGGIEEELQVPTMPAAASHSFDDPGSGGDDATTALEVRMLARPRDATPAAAALRLTTAAARHAPAWLMAALRSLDLPVQHACVCRVGGVTVQDAVVDVPAAALRDEGFLRAALLRRLQQSG